MYSITLTIILKSPMHIGALAPAGTAAVRGIVKTRDGWPFVPASSFKGRLRHSIEKLAKGLNRPVCQTHNKMCRDLDTACPVCRVFGSPWLPGSVNFVDLELSGPSILVDQRKQNQKNPGLPPPPTLSRYGVGIDRKRRVASDHLLYTTELFQPGVPLEFSGKLENINDLHAAAWICAGLRYLDSLGSDRTRGLGWISTAATTQDADGHLVNDSELRKSLEG